jgi:uncharacterized OB-fold protein
MDVVSCEGTVTTAREPLSGAYWEGAERGKLVLQRCGRCGKIRHYPRVLCDACYSFDVEPFEAQGRGTIHSWTVAHHAFDPAFADATPYVLLTVDMEEGVRVLGRYTGQPRMGAPVRITFMPAPDGSPMPVFVPA